MIARADGICADAVGQAEARARTTPEPSTQDALLAQMDRGLATTRKEIAALERLNPPEEGRADFEAFLNGKRDYLAKGTRAGEAAKTGESERFDDLNAASLRAQESAEAAALRYGLKECGKLPRLRFAASPR